LQGAVQLAGSDLQWVRVVDCQVAQVESVRGGLGDGDRTGVMLVSCTSLLGDGRIYFVQSLGLVARGVSAVGHIDVSHYVNFFRNIQKEIKSMLVRNSTNGRSRARQEKKLLSPLSLFCHGD
jgi:hypothetical protein